MAIGIRNAKKNKLNVRQRYTRQEFYGLYGGFASMSITRNLVSPTVIGATYVTSSLIVPYGFNAKVSGVTMKSNVGGRITGYISRGYAAPTMPNMETTVDFEFPIGGGSLTFPWGFNVEFLEGGVFDFKFVPSEAVTNGFFRVFPTGELISNDPNTDAEHYAESIGDSLRHASGGNLNGGSIPNLGYTHPDQRLINQMRLDGKDFWLNKRAFGGASTQDMVYAMQSGYYGRPADEWAKLKLLILGVGTNDAVAGNATATGYVAKIKQIINYYLRNKPDLIIALMRPTPTDDPARIPNIDSYGAAMLALTTDPEFSIYPDAQMVYVDTNIGFNVATASNYTETVAGTRLHYRWDTGGAIVYNNTYPVIQTTRIYTDYENL